MEASRSLKKLYHLSLLAFASFALTLAAYGDVATTRYATFKEAETARTSKRDWLPLLPSSASNIVENYNLDLNTAIGSFHYAPSDLPNYLTALSQAGATITTNEPALTAILTSNRVRWEINLRQESDAAAYTVRPITSSFGIYLVTNWKEEQELAIARFFPASLSSLSLTDEPSAAGKGNDASDTFPSVPDEPKDPALLAGIRLSSFVLSDEPVISIEDIVSYDFETHAMQLNPAVLARLPQPDLRGTPFVVVANGERIYAGMFTSAFSSFFVPGPVIMVERALWNKNAPTRTLVIGSSQSDLSSDPRIRQALSDVLKK